MQPPTSESSNEEEDEDENNQEEYIQEGNVEPVTVSQRKYNTEKPKRKMMVEFKLQSEDEIRRATVMNVQPKSGGKYEGWLNVNEEGKGELCVNWKDRIEYWREIVEENEAESQEEHEAGDQDNQEIVVETSEDEENVILLTEEQESKKEILDAKMKEIENLKKYEVFDVVPYTGQKTISSRWVVTEKFKDNQRKVKARLVARGFEENAYDVRTDSPTCSREAMRLVMIAAGVDECWDVETIDFSSAFLQGEALERDVFLRVPADVCSKSEVWKLKKCIYGLNDAPRAWFKKVAGALIELKGRVSAYDNALYMWYNEDNKLKGVIAMHVDDFEFCGNESFKREVVEPLKRIFNIGSHETRTFKYLGLEVRQTKEAIMVTQDQYISTILPVKISRERAMRKNDELSKDEIADLKRLAGQMMWVSTQTRPDVAFDVCTMSNCGKHAKVKTVLDANKTLLKVQSRKSGISFPHLGKPENLSITAYCDATYASLEDGSSQGGYIIFVVGDERVAPISWQSKKLDRVTKSPLASEALALNEAADAGFLASAMLQEIFQLRKLPPVTCKTDNSSLVQTLNSSNIVADKRLRVDISRLKEMMVKEEIKVEWIEGFKQVADVMTKAGASSELLRDILNHH